MAEGARAKTDSDYGIALTGVAGPDSLEGHQQVRYLLVLLIGIK
ncbi:MAG: CinA family protein [Streptococcus salivarius]